VALRGLRIERFRGVRSAEVSFDRTTVLIGENDCGMSSVLAALAVALSTASDRPKFATKDFHEGSGPVRISLTFVESRAGSWGRPGLEALAPVIGRRANKARKLTVEISAESAEAETHWLVRSDGGVSHDDLEVLATVRRINPFVWLHAGATVRRDFIESNAVVNDEKPLPGFAATKLLLADWVPDVAANGSELRAMVAEILARGSRRPAAPASASEVPRPPRSGSAAQELGVFLVAAELVHELERTSAPGARPIIVFEEPETHLHPMTLASVWGLLELFSTQKIVTTNSGPLLGAAPLRSVRRLVRHDDGSVCERRITRDAMSTDDMRKIGYHLRTRRSIACFARVWLLVEGETEFWIMPDLARLCGYDLAQEGVACVEFAQCGLDPLIKLATCLGIEWHLLTDGDRAGADYAATAQRYLHGSAARLRVTHLTEPDIEHSFWTHGYGPVFERLARHGGRPNPSPTRIIKKAIEKHSKPAVAFELLAAVAANDGHGAPPQLRSAIETSVALARGSVQANDDWRRSAHDDRTRA